MGIVGTANYAKLNAALMCEELETALIAGMLLGRHWREQLSPGTLAWIHNAYKKSLFCCPRVVVAMCAKSPICG